MFNSAFFSMQLPMIMVCRNKGVQLQQLPTQFYGFLSIRGFRRLGKDAWLWLGQIGLRFFDHIAGSAFLWFAHARYRYSFSRSEIDMQIDDVGAIVAALGRTKLGTKFRFVYRIGGHSHSHPFQAARIYALFAFYPSHQFFHHNKRWLAFKLQGVVHNYILLEHTSITSRWDRESAEFHGKLLALDNGALYYRHSNGH